MRQWLQTFPPVDAKLAAALQVLRGMAYLHRDCRIAHHDLKPENILVDAVGELRIASDTSTCVLLLPGANDGVAACVRGTMTGTMKLCDFGLSASGASEHDSGGTLPYLAPEVLAKTSAHSQPVPDTQTSLQRAFAQDVYSMGITLWEVFAHQALYPSVASQDLRQYVIGGGRFVQLANACVFEAECKLRCLTLATGILMFCRPDIAELLACMKNAAAKISADSDPAFAQQLSDTIEEMWGVDPATRPDFHSLVKVFGSLQKRWQSEVSRE